VPPPAQNNEHFGPIIVLCDHADLRLRPGGIDIFGDTERHVVHAPVNVAPRKTVIDALHAAVRQNIAPPQTAAWGRASLEVCHAILRSAETGEKISLTKQCSVAPQEETL
jgi:phthalate 4,5-cis-dihydrodiol dehydrogenase